MLYDKLLYWLDIAYENAQSTYNIVFNILNNKLL